MIPHISKAPKHRWLPNHFTKLPGGDLVKERPGPTHPAARVLRCGAAQLRLPHDGSLEFFSVDCCILPMQVEEAGLLRAQHPQEAPEEALARQ